MASPQTRVRGQLLLKNQGFLFQNSNMNGVLASGWYKEPLCYVIYSAYYCPPLVKVGLYFPQRWYDCTSLLRDLGVHRNICGLCTINLHIWKCKSIKQGTFHYRNPYFKCEPNLKWFHMLHIYDTNLEWFHMLHIYDTNFLIVKYVSGNELRLKCKILSIVLWSI